MILSWFTATIGSIDTSETAVILPERVCLDPSPAGHSLRPPAPESFSSDQRIEGNRIHRRSQRLPSQTPHPRELFTTVTGSSAGAKGTVVRSLFASDIHLGAKHNQADRFLEYLTRYRPENLYLVGDFLDGWKLRRKWRWTPIYSRIFERIAELLSAGTRVYYTPGNHDEFLRKDPLCLAFRGWFDRIELDDEFLFEAEDGRRFLVTHGDRFDVVETKARWLSVMAAFAYDGILTGNRLTNRLFNLTDRSPYAFASRVKGTVKNWVRFLSNFEGKIFDAAEERGADGLICGHIHTPGIQTRGPITYINTGDWVEHCTALVERDGTLELEHYFDRSGDRGNTPSPPALPPTGRLGQPRVNRPESLLHPVACSAVSGLE